MRCHNQMPYITYDEVLAGNAICGDGLAGNQGIYQINGKPHPQAQATWVGARSNYLPAMEYICVLQTNCEVIVLHCKKPLQLAIERVLVHFPTIFEGHSSSASDWQNSWSIVAISSD